MSRIAVIVIYFLAGCVLALFIVVGLIAQQVSQQGAQIGQLRALSAPHPAAAATASATTQACPPGQPAPTCFRGKVIMWDPKGDPNAAELVLEDGYGAPMMWVDMYGLYSGGEPVCITGLQFQLLACLGGPWSQTGATPVVTLYDHGRPVSLTVRDIRWLHAHGG